MFFLLNITDFFIEKRKVNVNAGRYIRYESFFVSLQKETHETHNSQRNKNINTQ